LYTQNLSLFAKLFLDTKSVFYDVTTFLYYLLIHRDAETGLHQVVGFFSKEKMSWDNNNLACILVFPPWQRQGHGQLLMGVSYELSKRDGRLGGPEKRTCLAL
jgi:GNAT superfamily N-acetyltransferase